ncbi:hypothetical protein POM88_002536 [Heracleum sosnowskyi]|uniref:Uncharacterized protein n=1 Tax=Heracleum sosnowskyi TaxID=360622 RepID=A0AAD8NC27_9APIA|nr:hypothetical protein POM88_002536 [Heracleum sosnowskyi]
MKRCNFSETIWGFAALSNLHLDIDVLHTKKKSDCFSGLDNLRNLTLNFSTRIITSFFISCPELVNLKIIAPCTTRTSGIVVVAPKLREVYCVGIFEVTLSAHELENAHFTISDLYKLEPSPFYNLKYVKLPQGYEESSISTTLKKYLLGGNPRATMVTELPQPQAIDTTHGAFDMSFKLLIVSLVIRVIE